MIRAPSGTARRAVAPGPRPSSGFGEYQQALGDMLWETDDRMEGVRSFTERREPRFRGR